MGTDLRHHNPNNSRTMQLYGDAAMGKMPTDRTQLGRYFEVLKELGGDHKMATVYSYLRWRAIKISRRGRELPGLTLDLKEIERDTCVKSDALRKRVLPGLENMGYVRISENGIGKANTYIVKTTFNQRKIAVIQTDLQGNFIAEHESMKAAGEALGVTRAAIRDSIKRNNGTCRGYKFIVK